MLIMYSQKLYRAFTVSVSLASTSLLVPAQNALRIVRKYVLEFFQPLAAPHPTKNHVQRIRLIQVMDKRAIPRAETRKQPKCTRRGAGVTRGTSGTTAAPENKERGKTEATEPNAGRRTREIYV